jgi:2',3'-cyclic-nucleotide 2'-phosphodiesterase (5'-nucleotidase family)
MNIFCRTALLLFLLVQTSCSTTLQKENTATQQYAIKATDTLAADESVLNYIAPFRDSLSVVMNEKVGYSANPMTKGLPESTLGNFVADACHAVAMNRCRTGAVIPPDFTVLNSGGLRSALPAGVITRGNIYELMPFENGLVIVTMTSKGMQQLLRYIALRKGNPVSGIRMQLTDSSAQQVFINGIEINPSLEYRMVTSDYLANGGDNMTFLKEMSSEALGIKVRDAILEYLQQKEGDTLRVSTDGRIYR